MKLWDKGISTDKKLEEFTVGKDRELDLYLAPYDVLGSLAHITMLESIGLLSGDELQTLRKQLLLIYKDISKGDFSIEKDIEDIHSQIEILLTRNCGETGKKVHSGRSRNDQVLLDLKLFTRARIESLVEKITLLFEVFITKSEQYKKVLMPGYTHLQIAMPSSFGLWFGAYAESLVDDLRILQSAYHIANQNPLGSAAGYGSSFPLNRQMTSDLLGFESLNYNVIYAQMGRGKMEKSVACAISSIAGTLGKFAADACMYMNQNFGFISLPDEFTTGSSIMPHKKNPDIFELIRANCNQLQSLPNEIILITNNLPSGYFRDMQLLKESYLPAFDKLENCLETGAYIIEKITVNHHILDDKKYDHIFSVEEVNKEVLKGVSFREAYKKTGEKISSGKFTPQKTINHTHEGSIGNLCNDKISRKMKNVCAAFDFETMHKATVKLLKEDEKQGI